MPGPITLSSQEKNYLQQIGISRHAIRLYALLLKHGSLTARQAAGISGEFPAAEYRLFRQLEKFGLVRRGQARPVNFTALPKDVGLRAAYIQDRNSLEQLVIALGLPEGGQHRLELIVGRQALYEKYAELANEAAQEICIYAIGIAYSDELLRTQREALKRGVRIQHVLQQVKPSNFHVAHKWQRLGVRLRYSPSERGFHLMLFDNRLVLISFSDPNDTDDRLSILTANPAALRLFEAYFQDIWSHAQKIKV